MLRSSSISSNLSEKKKSSSMGLFGSFRLKRKQSKDEFKLQISEPTNVTTRPLSMSMSTSSLNSRYLETITNKPVENRTNTKVGSYVSTVAKQRGGSTTESSLNKSPSIDSLHQATKSLRPRSSVPNMQNRSKRHSMFVTDNVSSSFLNMLADTETKDPVISEESEPEAPMAAVQSTFDHYDFALKELSRFDTDFDIFKDDTIETIESSGTFESDETDKTTNDALDYDLRPRLLRRTRSLKNLKDFTKNASFYTANDEATKQYEQTEIERLLRDLKQSHLVDLELDRQAHFANLQSSPPSPSSIFSSLSTNTLQSDVSIVVAKNVLFVGIEELGKSVPVGHRSLELHMDYDSIIHEEFDLEDWRV